MRLCYILIISCFLFTSTANAAMLCCWSTANVAHEMQLDQDMDKMPCHNMADNQKDADHNSDDTQNHVCNDCDCKNCSQLTAIIPQYQKEEHGRSINRLFTKTDRISYIPDSIFYPPKHIS